MITHTALGWRRDQQQRSKQDWERGKGAKKKGNPRYAPKTITNKKGKKQKVYVVRKKK